MEGDRVNGVERLCFGQLLSGLLVMAVTFVVNVINENLIRFSHGEFVC